MQSRRQARRLAAVTRRAPGERRRAYTAAPVNPALLALAGAVAVAAVVAVSARDGRVTIIGLVAALALGPLVAEPLPDPLSVAARIAAATLAGVLLRIALRDAPVTRGSRLGWPTEAAAAAAAFATGIGAHSFAAGGDGPSAAVGAGFALIALAIAPLADARDMIRLGTGLLLLIGGADLARVGFAGTPSAIEELMLAGVVAIAGGTIALLAARDAAAPGGIEPGNVAKGHREP
jgi:hypothetical protein